jgi:hypothetical protein
MTEKQYVIFYPILLQLVTATVLQIAEKPFQATSLNESMWECNNGFYRTTPTKLWLATCKKCLSLNITDCSDDSYLLECSPYHDVECIPCPPLLNYLTYTPNKHDCNTTQCKDGYYQNTYSLCIPCPSGSYCSGGQMFSCGKDLITLSEEETSQLGCVPTKSSAAWQIQITLYFSLVDSGGKALNFCLNKKDIFTGWLHYGRLIDCNGQKTSLTDEYDGEMSCIILIAKEYTDDYIQWLDTEIQIQKSKMIKFIQMCIANREISYWSTRTMSMEPETAYYFRGNTTTTNTLINNTWSYDIGIPKEYPDITSTIRYYWGANGKDIANFVFAITLLSFSSCISIFLLIAGFILRCRKIKKFKGSIP